MSESDQPDNAGVNAEATSDAPGADGTEALPEEWKPEPREWTWKDLFTAPMLAFKPKCMLISVLTVLLIGLFSWAWYEKLLGVAGAGDVAVVGPVLTWIGYAVAAAIFGLGATLVSVFMKADLLDDEFLSLKEALGQFKGRFLAAVMVPLFLVGVLAGFFLLIYLGELLCSIPFVGSAIYAVLYPLAVLLALFTVLLTIGVLLSIFVGPAVISVRRHGWFDNVIDTFEAVGTKPHVLVGNLVLTLLMVLVCYGIGHQAMVTLSNQAASSNLPNSEVALADHRGSRISLRLQRYYDLLVYQGLDQTRLPSTLTSAIVTSDQYGAAIQKRREARIEGAEGEALEAAVAIREPSPWYHWGTGLVVGGWKVLLTALIAGYAVNIFLAGGMLTYLAVREDDYWDDEDLEDLDQLAKELEEEAKREEAAAEAKDPAAAAPAPAAEAAAPKDDDPTRIADSSAEDEQKQAAAAEKKKRRRTTRQDDKPKSKPRSKTEGAGAAEEKKRRRTTSQDDTDEKKDA